MGRDRHSSKRSRAGDTGDAFVEAATRLFAERGYNGTSIGDLAAELGLTTASLYYHVRSKQELLLRVLQEGMSESLARLEAIAARPDPAATRLRAAVRNHLDLVLANPQAVAIFLRERRFLEPAHRDQYVNRIGRYDAAFTGLLVEAMEEGVIRQLDPTLARLTILGMINWVTEWYSPDGRLSRAELTKALESMIMDDLLGEGGPISPSQSY